MTIAYYARKSNEKKTDSIENQLSIIDDYIRSQKEFSGADIIKFSDSGFTGINLERDQFQELLSKVRQREIDVIAVKDFSRLGRNYLDVCKLADRIFPFMNVRLISVSENYDSKYKPQNYIDLGTAFKAVLNEYYVIESSDKIQKSCRMRIRQGEFMGYISYGYKLSDKYTPVINEEQAKIVREIFDMYIGGTTIHDIAGILNKRGIKTNRGAKWNSISLRWVLKNEQYIGKKVAITKKLNVKTKRYTPLDESHWYINDTAFPPIIERDVFERAQAMFGSHQSYSTKDKHIMSRKLYCAKCGKTLCRNKYFYCKNGYITGEQACFSGSVKPDVLYPEILSKVKSYIGSELGNYKAKFSFSDKSKIEAEITKLKEKKAKIFDELFNALLTEDEFQSKNTAISAAIQAKQDELKECCRMAALVSKYGLKERPIDTLKRLYNADELTKEHMQFVKRINVFDKDTFEIILENESPLSVLCRNMDIYEEEI